MPITSVSSNLTISIGGINLQPGQHILNNNSNLVPFTKDGLELVIDLKTGASYAPGYNALARICSIGLEKPIDASRVKKHVSSLLKAMSNSPILEAEVQTSQGTRTVSLINESLMAKTIRKFNDSLSDKIDEAGMRVFNHKLAGYKISSTASKPKTSSEALLDVVTELVAVERRVTGTEGAIEVVEEKVEIVENNLSEITLRLDIMSKSLPWTGREMRVAIANCLDNPEQATLSNIRIGKICYCSESMVRKVKGEILDKSQEEEQSPQQTSKKSSKKSSKKLTRIQLSIDLEMGGE